MRLSNSSKTLLSAVVALTAMYVGSSLAPDESPFRREGAARKPQAGCRGQGVGQGKRRDACTIGTGVGAFPRQRRCAHPRDKASSLSGGEHGSTPGKPDRERPEKYFGTPRDVSSRRRTLRARTDVPGATGLRMSCSARHVYRVSRSRAFTRKNIT